MKVPDALRDAAFPPPSAIAAWRGAKQPALIAGLERVAPELRGLQGWAAEALSSRKKLGAPLGEEGSAELGALVALCRDNAVTLAAELVSVHGLLPVLEAALAEHAFVARYQHGKAPALWLVPASAEAPAPPVVAVRPSRVPWIDATRSWLDRAPPPELARARALAAKARLHLPLTERAALARAFRDEAWAEADAVALAVAPPSGAAELASIVQRLLPYVATDEAFEALAARATSALFHSKVYAEILVRTPAERALRRLARLLELPLAVEATAHVVMIVEAIACFDEAAAAEAIARAAHVARAEAKAYFLAHPEHRRSLVARAEGRGKTATTVRAIVVEIERAEAARRAVDDPVRKLPRCLAEPPWRNRPAPWPARDLAPICDGERITPTAELRAQRPVLFPRTGGDAAILAESGQLDEAEFAGLSDEAALANVERLPVRGLGWPLMRFGERALEAVSEVLRARPMAAHAPIIAMIRSPRIAAVVWDFHEDERWLLADPTISALGLIPELFAVSSARRWTAEMGLLRLVVAGHRAAIEEAAARWNIERDVAAILDRDPWSRVPEPLPALHRKVQEDALTVLATREGPLPPSTTATVAQLVAISPPFLPHPGLLELRAECTEESRSQLAWELSEETGATKAIALLGGDGAIRLLDRQLSAKRPEMKPAERFAAFDALAWNGSPLALALLMKQALSSPWPDRNEAIDAHLDEIARRRGLARWELEDETFAALAFDGTEVDLDYGARSFGLRVDDHLVPYVVAADGARLDGLPKPTRKDDPSKSAAAKATLRDLTLDLDDIRVTLFAYFERAMATGRSWEVARFRRIVVGHPLLGRVARSLVFELDVGDGSRFVRIAEDGTFADARDVAVTASDRSSIGVAHPLHLSADERAAFRQVFDDYAIFPPFAQLARETYALRADEREAKSLTRFQGRVVATARVGDLLGARGWQHGRHPALVKPLGSREVCMVLRSRRGGATEIEGVTLAAKDGPDDERPFAMQLPFSLLSDVEASELLRDLEMLPLAVGKR